MTPHHHVVRRWLYGYIIVLFVSLPAALPSWNGFLRDWIGPFITIDQIHLVLYVVLGGLAAVYGRAKGGGWRTIARLVALVLLVGVLDETIQRFLPGRFFEWSDIVLNWIGSLAGLVVIGAIGWGLGRLRRSRALR